MNKEQLFEQIARERLGIITLAVRKSDGLDFHEVSVTGVHDALDAAYEAGKKAVVIKKGDRVKQLNPPDPERMARQLLHRMSIDTPYEVEAVTPSGLLVLKDFLCLVGQDEVEKV